MALAGPHNTERGSSGYAAGEPHPFMLRRASPTDGSQNSGVPLPTSYYHSVIEVRGKPALTSDLYKRDADFSNGSHLSFYIRFFYIIVQIA